jgi:hypothetical protein
MGQNFDYYSDFQKIPVMPILLQHSVVLLRRLKVQIFPRQMFWKTFPIRREPTGVESTRFEKNLPDLVLGESARDYNNRAALL